MAEEAKKTTIADLKINSFQNPVENLPDRPTMSASELKRHFDSNSEELREAFNRLIDALTGTGGASEIFTAAGISVEVALENRIQWNGAGVKYIRLNKDKVLETSEDGQAWEATGSGGHIILDRDGNTMPQRNRLFFDQCEVSDDGEKTVIHGIKGEKGEAAANPNLLDNWYWANPINQRGWTSAATSYEHHLDRWIANDVTVTVHDGYVTLKQSGTSNLFDIQRVEADFYKNALEGKTITLSALLRNGILKTATVTAPDFQSNMSSDIDVDGLMLGVYSLENEHGFRIFPTVGYSFDIVAVKAEFGSQQTLARQENGVWVLNDAPPNKALELEKCQRYFQIARGDYGYGFINNSTDGYFEIPLATIMRTTPVVTVNSYGGIMSRSGVIMYTSITSCTFAGMGRNGIILKANGTMGDTIGVATWASINIDISADL